MEILLQHIVPVLGFILGTLGVIAVELLIRKGKIRLPETKTGLFIHLCVLAEILVGTGLIVYLMVIGAGVEVILPCLLLILLATLI